MWTNDLAKAMACAVRVLGAVVVDTIYGCEDGIIFDTSSFDVYKWVATEDTLYINRGYGFGRIQWEKVEPIAK